MLYQERSNSLLEEVFVVAGLLAVQCILAFYVVFVKHLLALGGDPLSFIVLGAVASSVVFLPFAVVFERKKWPAKISFTLMAQFFTMALIGTTLFQSLMLLGIQKTSPAVSSAMPNLAPGLIFIIAACLGFEKFDKTCKYTRAKILGTLVCLCGAMAMSFLRSPASSPELNSILRLHSDSVNNGYNDWILGCFCLLSAVIFLSFNTVLQAATMASFPAPLSLCVITSMIGAIFTAILQIIMEGKISIGDISLTLLAEIVVLGGVVVGACVVFQTWCLSKKGPLLVSIFSPVQTVCSAILSAFVFGQMVSLGSLAGITLMFTGLYLVLWAKNSESNVDQLEASDVEKPLLS